VVTTAKAIGDLFDQVERKPDLLVDADLTVERDGVAFSVRGYDDLVAVDLPSLGAPVARLGADAVPSPLANRLGLGPIELFLDGALLALTPRRE